MSERVQNAQLLFITRSRRLIANCKLHVRHCEFMRDAKHGKETRETYRERTPSWRTRGDTVEKKLAKRARAL